MTSLPGPTAEKQVAFLGMVERILSEGQYVAAYKYALLLAIADLAVKHGRDEGGELDLPICAIAGEFIELYWRQGAPYGNSGRRWQLQRPPAEYRPASRHHFHRRESPPSTWNVDAGQAVPAWNAAVND